MKNLQLGSIVILLLFSLNIYSAPQIDSLGLRVMHLEKNMNKINAISDKLDNIDTKLDTKTNNLLTDNSNLLGFVSIFLAVIVIAFGFQYFFHIRESKEIKNEIKEIIKTTKEESDKLLKDVTKSKNEIDELKKRLLIEIKDVQDVRFTVEKYQNELKTLKETYERDKYLVTEYSDACEKLEEGLVEVALKKYNIILQRDPDFYKASIKIAMCYSSFDENHEADKKIAIVLADLNSKYKIDTNPSILDAINDAYSSQGVILRRLYNYDAAIDTLSKLIVKEGNEEIQLKRSTFSHLGYCYLYKKEFANAMNAFQKGKSQDKSSPSYYGLVKTLYLKDKKIDKDILEDAISISERDILYNPKYPYYNFGAAFMALIKSDTLNDLNMQKLFQDYLKSALLKCKNLGILNEQLFEYKLVKELVSESENVKYAISTLEESINMIQSIKTKSQAIISKNYVI